MMPHNVFILAKQTPDRSFEPFSLAETEEEEEEDINLIKNTKSHSG